MIETSSQLYKIRHSMAHILAQAVKQEYPQVKLGFGPPIEYGFYYDFDFAHVTFGEENLKAIEKRMKKILRSSQSLSFEHRTYGLEEALQICEDIGEPYKKQYVRLMYERGERAFSFYTHGGFVDLCEGPHVSAIKDLPVNGFKLYKVSGAYWLGDESHAMLTRIYAHCFETQDQLKEHLERIRRAEQFDHRKLGKQLELFHFDDRVGKGLPLWLPAGMAVRSEIERYAEEMEFAYGYQRVRTPCIAHQDLYRISGHLPMYEESMYPPVVCDGGEHEKSGADKDEDKDTDSSGSPQERYYLRPMTCPHHHLIYGHKTRSYRELPLRLAEYGDVFRYEQSGEVSGLIRVRNMTINDGHIYCAKSQVEDEVRALLEMHQTFYDTFQLSRGHFSYRLSLRENTAAQGKYQGGEEEWRQAEEILRRVLQDQSVPFVEAVGEAAFYGPKIDVQFRNLMGREETVSTVQLDFLAAQNFDLKFINDAGKEEHCVVIHRAPLSSHERFLSYLIEYYGGAFPTWCAPLQVGLIPIHDRVHDYVQALALDLKRKRVRVKCAFGSESFSKKLRTNMTQKIPISVVIGDEEKNNSTVTVRRWSESHSTTMAREDFLLQLLTEIQDRVFVQKERLQSRASL